MVFFLFFPLVKVSVGQFECDLCLEVGCPDGSSTSNNCDSLVGTFRFQGHDPDCPDGCAYTKDGDPDTWCFGEGSYPASATCPAAQISTSEPPITTSLPPSTSSVFPSTTSSQTSP